MQGTKIHNHLYHMKMVIRPPTHSNIVQSHQTFIRNNTLHVGYTGLQKLFDRKIVDGFIVDEDSPKLDVCTEAKQHFKPFPKSSIRNTEPGELTHIDLWGKYLHKARSRISPWWNINRNMLWNILFRDKFLQPET